MGEQNVPRKKKVNKKTILETEDKYFPSKKKQEGIAKFFIYILLFGISVILLAPLWWMVSTSLKPMEEIVQYPPSFIPESWQWSNYLNTIRAFPFIRYAKNTLFITFFVVVGNVVVNSFIAYGFAKVNFPGKKVLFSLVLATMMIPGFVTMIPQYILFTKFNWVGTYLPLIVPSFFGNAFNIFLMRQFYMSINNDMSEAAQLEGANHFYIWSRLMIPMTKPALITIAITSFNGAWNDFLGPLLYIQDEQKYTLQIGLQTFKSQSGTQWNYLMAGATLVMLPTVLLFFFAQKYFIEGMDLTGSVKG